MTSVLQAWRDQERRARLAKVEQLIAEAGSVRRAAKDAGIDRAYLIRLRKALRQHVHILTPPPAGPTN